MVFQRIIPSYRSSAGVCSGENKTLVTSIIYSDPDRTKACLLFNWFKNSFQFMLGVPGTDALGSCYRNLGLNARINTGTFIFFLCQNVANVLLQDHRVVVRIDSWESTSLYPNGHSVRVLGRAGELETEVKTILIENRIKVPPFSDAQVRKEAPFVLFSSLGAIS